MKTIYRGLLFALAALAAGPAAQADERADALIDQVRDAAEKTAPIEADYTVTFREGDVDLVTEHRYVRAAAQGASHTSYSRPGRLKVTDLPPHALDLFDPFLEDFGFSDLKPPTTSYQGVEIVGKTRYDLVQVSEVRQNGITVTQRWYIGPDRRIYRMNGRIEIKLLKNPAGKIRRLVTMEGLVKAYKTP